MSIATGPTREETLHVRDSCLCLHLQRAARAVARRFDEALRPCGVSSGQFSLLMSLNRPVPPTVGQESSALAMDRTTVTANLKPLERRGLVSVRRDDSDGRARRPVLTGAGREILARAVPVWRDTHDRIDMALAQPDADLRANLRAIAFGLDP